MGEPRNKNEFEKEPTDIFYVSYRLKLIQGSYYVKLFKFQDFP